MDDFTQRDLIQCMRNIAESLKNMESKLDDITVAIREMGTQIDIEESEEDEE